MKEGYIKADSTDSVEIITVLAESEEAALEKAKAKDEDGFITANEREVIYSEDGFAGGTLYAIRLGT